MSSGDHVQKRPQFSGKEKDYPLYMLQLQAYAVEAGFSEAMVEAFDHELPASEDTVLDESVPSEKRQAEARDKNTKLMRTLLMGIKDPKLINYIALAKSNNWKGGKGWLVLKEMARRYAPDDDIAEMEMEEELDKIKLTASKDPNTILDDIARIQVKYSCSLDEKKKAATVMRAGRKVYAQQIASTVEIKKEVHSRVPTANELVQAMHKQWRIKSMRSKKNDDDSDDDGNEVALANADGGGNPNIICYKCGKKGHKANKCKSKGRQGNGNGNKFKGDCNNCGKPGHMAKDCWEDPKNADKRPKGYKSKKSDTEANGAVVEVLIASVEMDEQAEGKYFGDGAEENVEFTLTSIQAEDGKDADDGSVANQASRKVLCASLEECKQEDGITENETEVRVQDSVEVHMNSREAERNAWNMHQTDLIALREVMASMNLVQSAITTADSAEPAVQNPENEESVASSSANASAASSMPSLVPRGTASDSGSDSVVSTGSSFISLPDLESWNTESTASSTTWTQSCDGSVEPGRDDESTANSVNSSVIYIDNLGQVIEQPPMMSCWPCESTDHSSSGGNVGQIIDSGANEHFAIRGESALMGYAASMSA